jgi:hypothetical protein
MHMTQYIVTLGNYLKRTRDSVVVEYSFLNEMERIIKLQQF